MATSFNKESDFEKALINKLTSDYGWDPVIIKYPKEEDLIKNWADILFENNRAKDRLGDYPLTKTEMQQILTQIDQKRTPLNLNGFINGKEVVIRRDNPDDTLHLGKDVTLKIYDRSEIAAGSSRYQIAWQPKFRTPNPLASDRRGDFMLLINGMPVIHVELKKSGIPVMKACNQIEKYTKEKVFASGILSLVQVFVAMNPEETVYFANPGVDGDFNPNYYFHWADANNEPINDWSIIAKDLLSIPMAHELIGFYTVADDTDGKLKVLRSYQIYAAKAISSKVGKIKWEDKSLYGGYVWHTTGSGKTMTSYKSAQLIKESNLADKVVFLIDRIELGTQSLDEYNNYSADGEDIQDTENTSILIAKLKSSNPQDRLIVTSIQKMSRITKEKGAADRNIKKIYEKNIIFIVDECHRSTFGTMLRDIKQTFPRAIFFGFTGTPIHEENEKKGNTTATIFGDELHRYSIADGIRDGNVLGFDTYMVETYKEKDVRKQVALHQAKAKDETEAISDTKKSKVYYHYLNDVPMAKVGSTKGIEDYLKSSQYNNKIHRGKVVEDIKDNWITISHNGKFHGLLATSSIVEAIKYYELIKTEIPELKVCVLFDPNIDNSGGSYDKEVALTKILEDYNSRYSLHFDIPHFALYKKDVAARLAHKKPYLGIEKTPEKQIDLLIVVDQMLTGFDSKWLNVLYLDKKMEQEYIVQAFSRTNRLFGPEKPMGVIRYYRFPYTMKNNIEEAFKHYSGDKTFDIFVNKLPENIEGINSVYRSISDIFDSDGIKNFSSLPKTDAAKQKFVKEYNALNKLLEAAYIQGFTWKKKRYPAAPIVKITEAEYNAMLQRYKEISSSGGGGGIPSIPYDIKGYITEIHTDKIDSDYMNSKFTKYLRALDNGDLDAKKNVETELHKSFAMLSIEDQLVANSILNDLSTGTLKAERGKTLTDYIAEYKTKAQDDSIHKFATDIGANEEKLRNLILLRPTSSDINQYGRFDEIKDSVDITKAKEYLAKVKKRPIKNFEVKVLLDTELRSFILDE